jgi:hypothetical protein
VEVISLTSCEFELSGLYIGGNRRLWIMIECEYLGMAIVIITVFSLMKYEENK